MGSTIAERSVTTFFYMIRMFMGSSEGNKKMGSIIMISRNFYEERIKIPGVMSRILKIKDVDSRRKYVLQMKNRPYLHRGSPFFNLKHSPMSDQFSNLENICEIPTRMILSQRFFSTKRKASQNKNFPIRRSFRIQYPFYHS